MKKCKFILNEISNRSACNEIKTHLADCQACSAAYGKEIQLREFLLGVPDAEPPENLKSCILNRIEQTKKSKLFLPIFQMAFRTAVLAAIVVAGYWLGNQTANGNSNEIPNDTKITRSQTYSLNTAPVDQSSLSEIYFKVVEGVEDE